MAAPVSTGGPPPHCRQRQAMVARRSRQHDDRASNRTDERFCAAARASSHTIHHLSRNTNVIAMQPLCDRFDRHVARPRLPHESTTCMLATSHRGALALSDDGETPVSWPEPHSRPSGRTAPCPLPHSSCAPFPPRHHWNPTPSPPLSPWGAHRTATFRSSTPSYPAPTSR